MQGFAAIDPATANVDWRARATNLAADVDRLTRERDQERHARQLHSAEIARLTIERDEARAAALEEAAKVADGMRLDLSGPYPADREDYHFNDALEQAAENIRALKEPT
jgi:hypothetical protein